MLILHRKINETRLEIELTSFWSQHLEIIRHTTTGRPPERILCLGIGRFSECHTSRHQLAYILAIRKAFKRIEHIEFHEPALSAIEISVLNALHCHVHLDNLEGKIPLKANTLAYLPHCPKQLTNNLLWRNWSARSLAAGIILIGNSFAQIVAATPQRFLEKDAKFIGKIAENTVETTLPNTFRFCDIFNDTSVHTFAAVQSLSTTFWTEDCAEPRYEDQIELITRALKESL